MSKISITTLWCCLLATTALWAQRQQVDRVIGMVGNNIILPSDLEAQLKMMENQSQGTGLPPDARGLIFDQLLSNALMLAEAERDSMVVEDAEVQVQLDQRVSQILIYMGGSEEKFFQFYQMTPSEMKDFMRDQMHDQILQQKKQQEIMATITITPKEVKEFYASIPRDSLPYFNAEVELAEVVIKPKINALEDARAQRLARNLLTQIVTDSVDFSVLARRYSDDRGSAAQGGELGPQPRGTLVPEFEAAAYQLKSGEVSDVVKSDFGYHIIQLNKRLGNTIDSRHILVKPKITTEDREGAYQYLDSIRTLIINDSMTFSRAIADYSEEEFSKTRAGRIANPATGQPYFELGDLDPSIYFAIDGLEVGDITKVVEYESRMGEKQFRIVKLMNRTEPHIANLKDDYSKIRNAALEAKKGRYIRDWINSKLRENYVEIKVDNLGEQANELYDSPAMQKWMDSNRARP